MQIKEVTTKNEMIRIEVMLKLGNSGNQFVIVERDMDIRDDEGDVGAWHNQAEKDCSIPNLTTAAS